MTTTADDITMASRVLTDYFIDFEVDARLLRHALAGHPNLVAQAAAWGWNDTEVRGELAGAVCGFLLGRPWPTYVRG